MSFLNTKDVEGRDAMIADYLALKKRLKERNLEERGYLMDPQETFEPVVASDEKMVQDIIGDLTPITEGLHVINKILEAKKEPPRPKIGSKRRFVSKYGPFAETFLREYMDDKVVIWCTIRKFMIRDKVIEIQDDNIEIDGEMYMGTPGLWVWVLKYSIVSAILRVGTLDVTNRNNGLKFSDRFGKNFSGKGRCPILTRRNVIAPS